jgi:hypothetical protein
VLIGLGLASRRFNGTWNFPKTYKNYLDDQLERIAMRVLIRNIVILTTALSLLLGVIIGITYRDINRWIYLVINPRGSICAIPCLFGLMPATDRFDESVAKIKAHPLLRPADSESYTEGFSYIFLGGEEVTSLYSTSKSKIALTRLENSGRDPYSNSLDVEFNNDAPSVGDILLLFGEPGELRINYDERSGNGSMIFLFDIQQNFYTMTIPFDDLSASLSPDSKIKSMRLIRLQTPFPFLKGT